MTIQKNYRAHFYRHRFLRKRSAVLVLQKCRRGQVARSRCRKLRDEKRKREEDERRKKEEEEKKREGYGAQMKGGDADKAEDEAAGGTQVSWRDLIHEMSRNLPGRSRSFWL